MKLGILGTTLAGIGDAAQRFWAKYGGDITYVAFALATEGMSAEAEGASGGRMRPDLDAEGAPHTVFKRNPQTGAVSKYETFEPQSNPQNPNPYESTGRFDRTGKPHRNKITKENVPTPHMHDPSTPGGVRPARPEEIPNP